MTTIMRSGLLCLVALACWTTCQGYIATPLIGYQQGFTLQISPPQVAGGQCLVYGVPTPTGYADRAPGPLFVSTPKNTGNHVLQFAYDQAQYRLSPFLAPGQTTLQIDASDEKNPLISFDATASPQDQSGAVTVYLSDPSGANAYCSAQIQFTVSAPLACLPNYGGVYPQNGGNGQNNVPAPPNGAGNFVIPSGTVYAPTFVQQTIIQQFTTINNININNIVVNVNQITINNPIPEVPPTPPPVNCTEDPTNPVCASQPPAQPPLGPVPEPTGQPPVTPVPEPTAQPPNTPAQTPGFSILPVPPAQTPGPSTLPIGVPPSGNPTQTPGFSTLPIGLPPSSNPTQTPGVSTLPLVPPPVYVNPIRTPPSFGNGENSQPPSQFNQSGRRMKV